MNKFSYILILIIGFLVNLKSLYGDQPNGEPWSENSTMESKHEILESTHGYMEEQLGGCNIFCELAFDIIREEYHEEEEDTEEREEWNEFYHSLICPFC